MSNHCKELSNQHMLIYWRIWHIIVSQRIPLAEDSTKKKWKKKNGILCSHFAFEGSDPKLFTYDESQTVGWKMIYECWYSLFTVRLYTATVVDEFMAFYIAHSV